MKLSLKTALALYLIVSLVTLGLTIHTQPDNAGVLTLIFAACLIGIYVFMQMDQLQRDLDSSQHALAEQKKATDSAYYERNVHVALLARFFPSGLRPTDIEGWDPAWQNCVYIDLPMGQISYHYHDREADLFSGLPPYTKPWDGHEKADVHNRMLSTSTYTGLVPAAWLDHWIASNLLDAENCVRIQSSAEQQTYLQHKSEFLRWLNSDLCEYLSTRVFFKRRPELNWGRKASEKQGELLQLGCPLLT